MSRARHLWRWACGLDEEPNSTSNSMPTLDAGELARTEWSYDFERLMRCRLIVGAYRYGPIGASRKPKYDRAGAIAVRIRRYEQTGNVDLLVDVANLALLEFVEGDHPRKHLASESHEDTVEIVEG